MRSIKRTFCQVLPVASALTATILAAGCGDDPVGPAASGSHDDHVSPETATLVSVGETVQLTATVHDQHGAVMTGVAVTWSSRDPSVVTVSRRRSGDGRGQRHDGRGGFGGRRGG